MAAADRDGPSLRRDCPVAGSRCLTQNSPRAATGVSRCARCAAVVIAVPAVSRIARPCPPRAGARRPLAEPPAGTVPDVPDPGSRWGEPSERRVQWWPVGSAASETRLLSGIDYLRGVRDGRFPPPPIASTIGSRLVEVSEEEVRFRCVPHESFLNPLGLVHGGLLCALLDSAMGVAVQARCPPGVGYATIELKVSFLRPLTGDGREIEASGRALRVGRRVAFAEAHARDEDGTLVGHATSSLAALSR
jgi:uncharacterized protein (TIGR00369 family)